MRHGCKHEASAILAFEESMKQTHTNFKVVKLNVVSLLMRKIPGCIAFATSLVYGQNPMNVTYDISQMCPHLMQCLKGGIMTPFPTT